MMPTVNISLTPEHALWVKEQVESGFYDSMNDVVEDALQVLIDLETEQPPDLPYTLDEIRALVQEGIDSGPAKPLDIVKILNESDSLREKWKRERRA